MDGMSAHAAASYIYSVLLRCLGQTRQATPNDREKTMADIQLRFHFDMLALSAPLDAALQRQGFDAKDSVEMLCLTEDEAVEEALRLESLAGPQCLVTPTLGITEARLAHQRLEDHAKEVVDACMAMVRKFKPQHTIAEIGTTGLPIDPNSKSSLVANRDQYSTAVRLFDDYDVDAFLLNDLYSTHDIRCALMGARRVSDKPIFASVCITKEGILAGRNESIEEALGLMAEYEASVAGIHVNADLQDTCTLVRRIAQVTDLPILVQLDVKPEQSRLPRHTHEEPFWNADTMVEAALQLRAAGAQFIRATGEPTASYTGALAATCMGLPCIR